MTDEQLAYLRGKLYQDTKQKRGGQSKKEDKKNPPSVRIGQNVQSTNEERKESKGQTDQLISTAGQIADETGVNEKTIRRDADYAEALDSLPAVVKAGILSGDVRAARFEVLALAKADDAEKEEAAVAVAAGSRRLPARPDIQPGTTVKDAKAKDAGLDLTALAAPYTTAVKTLGGLLTQFEKLAAHSKYGAWLGEAIARIKHDLREAKEAVSIYTPVAPCDKCDGKGCKTCRDTGFFTRGFAQSRKK